MKITAQDEYGLRILLRIAQADPDAGLSIPQLSEIEGLSNSYTAKLTRTLRMAGLISSTRGHKGGYVLSRQPEEIKIKEVIESLGGNLFDSSFCNRHAGALKMCTNSVNCSIRSLWRMVQLAVDQVLERVTLQDLMTSEDDSATTLQKILEENFRIEV